MMKNNKGFTLVEVAVVLVILAILAGITIPNVAGWIKDSEERSLISQTKIAVKAAEGLIAKVYANDGIPSYELTNVKINAESGLAGRAYGYEISENGNGNELLHLSYTEDMTYEENQVAAIDVVYAEEEAKHVTYCAYPDTCDKHDRKYTFIVGGYNHDTTPTPTSTTGGFYLIGDNETVYIKAIDVYSELQNIPQHGSGSMNATQQVISVENGNIIEYYYVRYTSTFQKKWSRTELLQSVKDRSFRGACPGTANNKQCAQFHMFYLGNSTEQIKAVTRYDSMHTGTLTYQPSVPNSNPNKYQIYLSNDPHNPGYITWNVDSNFLALQWELPVK